MKRLLIKLLWIVILSVPANVLGWYVAVITEPAPRTPESLAGYTYTDTLQRTITILGEDPVKGPGYVLVERDDGARWGFEIGLLKRLSIPLQPPAKEGDDAST